MDPEVVAALITAAVALIVAGVTAFAARSNANLVGGLQKEVDRQRAVLENELAEERAMRDARRSYEYDALKRVYTQCEPLLFQASELAEYANRRISGLAWSAHNGRIGPDGSGWLAGPDGYYFRSTVYAVMAPLTSAKILQRHLTTVDLGLEPRLQLQYQLLKSAFSSFADDFRLAGRGRVLPYDPDRTDPGEPDRECLLVQDPAKFRRQGFYYGTLDIAVESLVHDAGDRCKSFAEFLADWTEPTTSLYASTPDLIPVFRGFHPRTHPVLWRCLVAQYLLYDVFLRMVRDSRTMQIQEMVQVPVDVLERFDWRSPDDGCDEALVKEPFEVGCAYVRDIVGTAQKQLVGR